jgi:predicted Zn-ribbon and HTH transcriptional regulator
MHIFPKEYTKHTDYEILAIICENCGERFGQHIGARCPECLSIAVKNGNYNFIAPKLTTPKGNRRVI